LRHRRCGSGEGIALRGVSDLGSSEKGAADQRSAFRLMTGRESMTTTIGTNRTAKNCCARAHAGRTPLRVPRRHGTYVLARRSGIPPAHLYLGDSQALRLRPTASPFGARFPTRLTIPFKALNVSGAASSSASTNLSFDASGN